MNKLQKTLLGAALVAGSAVAVADAGVELLVSSFKIGSGTDVAFDVVGEGATAMDFVISIPSAEKLNIGLDGCVSGLPATHRGQCAVVGDEVKVVIYSPTNELLPAGEIGTIRFEGAVPKFKAQALHAFGPDGRPVNRSIINEAGKLTEK